MGIQVKAKPCRGIGKAAGWQGCGELQYERRYGLGKKCGCYAKWLLNTPEGQEQIQKETIKAVKPRQDLHKAIKEEKDLKSLSYLKQNTVNACHEYIKLRDRYKPCVSCGEPWNEKHQAGHFYKAELYSNLKFDEENIHNQCVGCNIHKDGNHQKYRERIHNRVGREGLDRLDKMAAEFKANPNFKWDREELIRIRKYYKEKTKELKKSLDL